MAQAQKPQLGFVFGGYGLSVGTAGVGRMNLAFAWDPKGQGVNDLMGEVWQASGFTGGVLGGGWVKSFKPVGLAQPPDGLSFQGKVIHFKLDNPGGATSGVADLVFDVFNEGEAAAVYTVSGIKAPNGPFLPNIPVKVKIKGISTQSVLEYQGFFEKLRITDDRNDALDIYENLMTEDSSLWV